MTPFDATGPLPAPGVTLLEASAGTGKTYSIASLCVRLIVEEGVRPDRILVVTFGKAATGELRDRVRVRLRDARDALGAALAGQSGECDDRVIVHLVRDPRATAFSLPPARLLSSS